MKRPRLITISFSHYCEKARWALDHARVPYVEESHLPGLHIRSTRKAGGKSVPVLVTAEKTLTDSADIVLYADAHASQERKLYPSDPAARREVDLVEALCNGELARASRVFVYHHALPNPRALVSAVRPSLTTLQAWLLPYLAPIVGRKIRRLYRIDDASAAQAADTMRRCFTELGARLENTPFLAGDTFTAADLTFASVTGPILLPEGHPCFSSAPEGGPAILYDMVQELRRTRAGEHAQAMYRGWRHAKNA
jgi:glutathione S-transferase